MKERVLDPLTWFSKRELTHTPRHFVVTQHPPDAEAIQWVSNHLSGRYSFVKFSPPSDGVGYVSVYHKVLGFGQIAFEDPKEAVLYELRWS